MKTTLRLGNITIGGEVVLNDVQITQEYGVAEMKASMDLVKDFVSSLPELTNSVLEAVVDIKDFTDTMELENSERDIVKMAMKAKARRAMDNIEKTGCPCGECNKEEATEEMPQAESRLPFELILKEMPQELKDILGIK